MSDPSARDLRVLVVLVHHGVASRVAAAMETVDTVARALDVFGSVDVREISAQPECFPVSTFEVASRLMGQWWLERRWARYLGVTRRWILSSGLLCIRLVALLRPAVRRSAKRQAYIELSLSAKHELAWRLAFDDRVDVLVLLEDDARTHDGSIERLRQLFELAMSVDSLAHTFVDLAGGLSPEELRLSKVQQTMEDGILRLSKAATNTACGYAVGSQVITRLAGMTIRDPASGRIPADWLINRCFMEADSQDDSRRITCLHSYPHALIHGSFAGTVSSSIR